MITIQIEIALLIMASSQQTFADLSSERARASFKPRELTNMVQFFGTTFVCVHASLVLRAHSLFWPLCQRLTDSSMAALIGLNALSGCGRSPKLSQH